MIRRPLALLLAALLAAPIFAQPIAPTPAEVAALRAASEIDRHRAAASTPLSVTISSREEVRQFYRTVFSASENISSGWTGSYTTGAAGTTTAAFKDAVALRINFFRALAGVPATVTLNSVFSVKDQQAALMMSGNNQLLHTGIPTSWTYYTADGAEAASKSNLDIGRSGPTSIVAYMNDFGSTNAFAGHRRWVLYPQTREMGTGDVPGSATLSASNALWVQDGNYFSARPTTRNDYVAWPAPGYMPYGLVYPRWSFSYANADFTAATVSVTRAGTSVPVRLEAPASGFGENSLVWVMDNLDATSNITFARPTSDTVYAVTVGNVRIGGVAQNFSYNVTVFDPDVAGPDFSAVTVTGAATASVGRASTFTVAQPAFANAFDWRSLQLASFAKIYGAESGLDGLAATTTPGYDVVQSIAVGAGALSYRLAHLSPRSTQTLLLPETFYVGGSTSTLTLQSRLGIATSIEVARIQISTDDGVSWIDLFAQPGTATSGSPVATEAAFVARSLSLAAYAGRTVRVRLAFTIEDSGVAFLPGANNTVGWFIDNLTLTGVQSVTASSATNVASGTNFSFTPAAAGTLGVQARGVLFGAYPMEWGPVASVVASGLGPSAQNLRITNLSILTSLTGGTDSFTLGYVVGNPSLSNPLSLVLRAAGPSLGAPPINYPGTMTDPKIELFAGSTKTTENNDWLGTAALKNAFASVGAFPFVSDNSKDAAALGAITTGSNSVIVSANDGGAGAVIAEIYDATPTGNFSPTGPRLINVSVLKPIGSSLTVGFVVGPSGSTGTKNILIRAVGPTLGLAPFNVPGVIADPQIELFNGARSSIGSNDNWGGAVELAAAFTSAGAFSLGANSKDAALTATLAPGAYTVVVTPSTGATGTGLVEVYELP